MNIKINTMNIKINLPNELESILRERAAKEGIPIESFVIQAVAERLVDSNVDENPISTSNFTQWLRGWSSHFLKLNQPVDDSRESIYAGCGELGYFSIPELLFVPPSHRCRNGP